MMIEIVVKALTNLDSRELLEANANCKGKECAAEDAQYAVKDESGPVRLCKMDTVIDDEVATR